MNARLNHPFSLHHLLVGFAMLLLATTVGAQSVANPDAADQAQPGTVSDTHPVVDAPYWAPIGGFEADTHSTGYGFFGPSYVHPITPNFAVTGQVFANYLYYQFTNGQGGLTKVTSPGASVAGGVRVGGKNWFQLQAGPSFKRRHVDIGDRTGAAAATSDTRVGFDVGSDLYVNPTSRSNIQALADYGSADKYTWGRIGFKQQISNLNWHGKFTHYLGVEYIGQGNKDITSNQYGGFIEFLHAPSSMSIMLRTGYKKSTFPVGPAKTGPWFAVGFYERLK